MRETLALESLDVPLMKPFGHIHANDVQTALTAGLLLACTVNLLIFFSTL
jgi:hypothetical protein